MLLINLLMVIFSADGITYSFGNFLPELIEKFDSDRADTSLIPSILVGVTLGSGERTFINFDLR